MKSRSAAWLTLAVAVGLAYAAPARAADDEYLPDSAVLARVDDRVITVWDFRDRYFQTLASYRTSQDSLGRVQFLKTLIDKDVLALEALARNEPLTFEDRHKLREYETVLLLNTLYLRAIYDPSHVTPEDIERYAHQFDRELHLQRIAFRDRRTAERVRQDLAKGRIKWKDAFRRYNIDDIADEGDVGWSHRTGYGGQLGLEIFEVEVGGISPVLSDRIAFYLYRVVEERKAEPTPPAGIRAVISRDVGQMRQDQAAGALFGDLRQRYAVTYDTTNVAWAAQKFLEVRPEGSRTGMTFDLSRRVPDFEPADTSRVLARSTERTLTIGQFASEYEAIPPIYRPSVFSLDLMVPVIDRMLMETQILELARVRGYDRDSLFLLEMDRKREQFLVEHLYEDSVSSRVYVTPDARREYYRTHLSQFVRPQRVKYASVLRGTRDEAAAVVAMLDAGASPDSIVEATKAAGGDASILDRTDQESTQYKKLLFEELRPGQSAVLGPDKVGNFLVLHVMEYTPPEQVSYEEAQHAVDESTYNLECERRLEAFLERLRPKHRIESHPERVMKILLRDPAGDTS